MDTMSYDPHEANVALRNADMHRDSAIDVAERRFKHRPGESAPDARARLRAECADAGLRAWEATMCGAGFGPK